MPVIGLGLLVPGPVALLGINEDDTCAGIFCIGVGPHIEVALRRAPRCLARGLEPGVLVAGVVDDEFGDDPQAALMRRSDEPLHIL